MNLANNESGTFISCDFTRVHRLAFVSFSKNDVKMTCQKLALTNNARNRPPHFHHHGMRPGGRLDTHMFRHLIASWLMQKTSPWTRYCVFHWTKPTSKAKFWHVTAPEMDRSDSATCRPCVAPQLHRPLGWVFVWIFGRFLRCQRPCIDPLRCRCWICLPRWPTREPLSKP